MEHVILRFVAPTLILAGLTQLYFTERWGDYYRLISNKGASGVRLNGLISLALGGPIVFFHNIWSGPPLLLTLFGWVLLCESALCFLVPRVGLAGLAGIDDGARMRIIKVTGALLVILGGVLITHLVMSPG